MSDLGHEIANQRLGHLATERGHGLASGLVQRLDFLLGQERDLRQGSQVGLGDAFGRGIGVQEPEYPANGDVLGESGQLGQDASQEIVEPIDGLGLLLELGLQSAGDFAQEEHGVG